MRLLATIAVSLATSAIGLLVAAVALGGFDISVVAFPIVVVIFAGILTVSRAALETYIDKHAHILSSFVGLIAAFVALVITDLVTDGLNIRGVDTWVIASLIVWLSMIAATLLVSRWIFRKITGRDEREPSSAA